MNAIEELKSLDLNKINEKHEHQVQAALAAGYTLEDLQAKIGGIIDDDCWIPNPELLTVDCDGDVNECTGFTPRQAAEQAASAYKSTGLKTFWAHISTAHYGFDRDGYHDLCNMRTFSLPVHPHEPSCQPGQDHDWQAPVEIVGGNQDNPGEFSKGGGAIAYECCMLCGCQKITDGWAQNPETGEEGLESIEYKPDHYTDKLREYYAPIAEDFGDYVGIRLKHFDDASFMYPNEDSEWDCSPTGNRPEWEDLCYRAGLDPDNADLELFGLLEQAGIEKPE